MAKFVIDDIRLYIKLQTWDLIGIVDATTRSYGGPRTCFGGFCTLHIYSQLAPNQTCSVLGVPLDIFKK
jgi:hypothetical protein